MSPFRVYRFVLQGQVANANPEMMEAALLIRPARVLVGWYHNFAILGRRIRKIMNFLS